MQQTFYFPLLFTSYTLTCDQLFFIFLSKEPRVSYLRGDCRKLESLKGLIIDGHARVDVDHHAGGSPTAEEALQDAGQLAVPERHHLSRTRPGREFSLSVQSERRMRQCSLEELVSGGR